MNFCHACWEEARPRPPFVTSLFIYVLQVSFFILSAEAEYKHPSVWVEAARNMPQELQAIGSGTNECAYLEKLPLPPSNPQLLAGDPCVALVSIRVHQLSFLLPPSLPVCPNLSLGLTQRDFRPRHIPQLIVLSIMI